MRQFVLFKPQFIIHLCELKHLHWCRSFANLLSLDPKYVENEIRKIYGQNWKVHFDLYTISHKKLFGSTFSTQWSHKSYTPATRTITNSKLWWKPLWIPLFVLFSASFLLMYVSLCVCVCNVNIIVVVVAVKPYKTNEYWHRGRPFTYTRCSRALST